MQQEVSSDPLKRLKNLPPRKDKQTDPFWFWGTETERGRPPRLPKKVGKTMARGGREGGKEGGNEKATSHKRAIGK